MTSTLERAVKLNESRKVAVKQIAVSSCLLLCAALAACAGKITPSVSDDLAEEIEAEFNGAGGSAATGNAGAAGSAATGNAGRAGSSNAAGGAAGAGDDDDDNGGAAGASMNGAAGSSMAGGAGASGDPDEGGAGASGTDAPTCDGFAILAANCGSSGCHGAGSNLGTFAASEDDAREYIGQPGAVCSSQGALIDTEDPGSSLMVTKLSDDPPCAQPMPLGGQPLPQADIDCIEDWIGGL
jgi:hypothetical protein